MNLCDETGIAIQLSIEAGKVLTQFKSTALNTLEKESARDIVSEIDIAAERIILNGLRSKFLDVSFISEEFGENLTDKENFWIIDPLDGTANYVAGLPIYGVSIAYVRRNQIFSAAIYLPETNDLFFAEKDKGAYRNNRKLQRVHKSLATALVSVTFPGKFEDKDNQDRAYQNYRRINTDSRGALRLGSSVYSLGMCALNHIDAVVGFNAKIWDIAAGILINTEAGAVSSLGNVDPDLLQHDYIIAPNELFLTLQEYL